MTGLMCHWKGRCLKVSLTIQSCGKRQHCWITVSQNVGAKTLSNLFPTAQTWPGLSSEAVMSHVERIPHLNSGPAYETQRDGVCVHLYICGRERLPFLLQTTTTWVFTDKRRDCGDDLSQVCFSSWAVLPFCLWSVWDYLTAGVTQMRAKEEAVTPCCIATVLSDYL